MLCDVLIILCDELLCSVYPSKYSFKVVIYAYSNCVGKAYQVDDVVMLQRLSS